jgi:hypothetical protein
MPENTQVHTEPDDNQDPAVTEDKSRVSHGVLESNEHRVG